MNWRKIASYAAAFLVVRVSLGFLEGIFFPRHVSILWGFLASFAATVLLFAHFAARQLARPLVHASIALALNFGADMLIYYATSTSGSLPASFLVLSWGVLAAGTLVGCVLGIAWKKR